MDSSSTEVVTEAAALLRLIETDSDSGDESSAINQYAVKMPLVLLESVLSDGFHKDAEACSVITGIDGATFRSRMFDFFLGIFFHFMCCRLVSLEFHCASKFAMKSLYPWAIAFFQAQYHSLACFIPEPVYAPCHGYRTRITVQDIKLISAALHTTPEMALKYVGEELQVNTKFTEDKGALINGHWECSVWAQLWAKMHNLLCCESCGLPALCFTLHGADVARRCFVCGSLVAPTNHKIFRYAQSHAEKIRKAQQKAAPWCAKLKKLEKYRACLAEARAYGWSHDVQKYTKKINKYQEQMKDELDAYSDFDVDIQRKLTTALHGHYNTRSLEFLEVLWPETTTYLPCPKVSENLKEQKISEHQEPEFEDVDFSAEAIRKRRDEHLADWDMRYQ